MTLMKTRMKKAVADGLEYLTTKQEQDGSFLSYLSLKPDIPDTNKPIKTVFMPALILSSLAHIDASQSIAIREKIVSFLLSQKSDQWTFNFLSQDDPERYIRNYPDDLDDTFCTYIALRAHNPDLITTELLVHMTKLLLATETAIGGPYRTWLAPPDSEKIWLDVDPAVNCNVYHFLNLVTTPPANLSKYIQRLILAQQFTSPYYAPFYPVVYYLARAYKGTDAQKLLEALQQKNTNTELSALECALSLSSMACLSSPLASCKPYVLQLLDSQAADGSWPAGAFCTDENKSVGLYYNGCSALTTAFVLEALALYQRNHIIFKRPVQNRTKSYQLDGVLGILQKDCQIFENPLKEILNTTLKKITASKNASEITHFAHRFNDSLHTPLKNQSKLLDTLGAANTYGWAAYTIYDDFLDDEGDPLLLPTANVALRFSYEYFLCAIRNSRFQTHVRQAFGDIDNANTWELQHYRFRTYKKRSITLKPLPDYSDLSPLANRSIGHALGPLAILVKQGVQPDSSSFQAICTAMKHYIIAKQLNDDAHDWQEDFLHGRITYVVAEILKELALPPGTYKFHDLLPTMQKRFWYHSLTAICHDMKHHLELSRSELAAASVLKKQNVITALMDNIDISIQDTLTKQAQTKQFLENF